MTLDTVDPNACAVIDARSFLFVPGNRPDRFGKALDSGADAVVLDLEDAVALDLKGSAREAIVAAWPAFTDTQRARLLVRMNSADTPWFKDDLRLLESLSGLGAVMLPKAENCQQIEALGAACPGLPVLPLIESAEGIAQLDTLASAPNVVRLGLGHLDLQADLGMACGEDEVELAPVRLALVVASRRAGLTSPVDGVTAKLNDDVALERDTQRSRRFGFGAKLSIHPSQIPGIHAALSPTEAECEWSSRVLAAQASAGTGVFSMDGKMVDAPVILLANQILKRRRAIESGKSDF
jgi:citrate lyase subunit beta/citryl-CoA lyase